MDEMKKKVGGNGEKNMEEKEGRKGKKLFLLLFLL